MNLRSTLFILVFITLCTIGGGGFFLTTHLEHSAWSIAKNHTDSTAEMIQKKISFFLSRNQQSSLSLARIPRVEAYFADAHRSSQAELNEFLKTYCETQGASLCYLMDRQGRILASSNDAAEENQVGESFGFRPYLTEAIEGRSAVYLALGLTTNRRGFYFSAPVGGVGNSGNGVAVVKYSVEALEREFETLSGIFALVDPKGIVFASNAKDWLYKGFHDLSNADRKSLRDSRQYGAKEVTGIGFTETSEERVVGPDGVEYLVAERELTLPQGWRIKYFYDSTQIEMVPARGLKGISLKLFFSSLFIVIGMIVFITYERGTREIAKRLRAESTLKVSEEQYRLLFEKSDDPMWVIYDGEFQMANEAAARALGYGSTEELISIHPSRLSPEFQVDGRSSFELANEMMRNAYENGYHRFEWLHRHKNGEVFPVEVTLTHMPFQAHDSLFCVWRNISHSKQIQHDLELAKLEAEQANQAKSNFLSTISHEIRTPMNGILGMAQLLADTQLDGEQREFVDVINRSGQSLLVLLNDILDFSKIEAGKMELDDIPFNLKSVLTDACHLMSGKAENANLRLTLDLPRDFPRYLRGDPGRLRQVILNLLENAIKFTQRGSIIVRARIEALHGDSVELRIEVADTGIGVSSQQKSKLFKTFSQVDASTTRKYGGTGLGLSICKQFITLMGGEIDVDSTPGEGSTFWFRIKLQRADPPKPFQAASLQGKRALLLDEDRESRERVRLLLEAMQLQIDGAGSLPEALGLLQVEQSVYDVISITLPAGGDLPATLRELSDKRNIPIVVLSHTGERGDAARFKRAGAVAYLSAPISERSLSEILAYALGSDPSGGKPELVTRHSIQEWGSDRPKHRVTQMLGRVLLAEDVVFNQRVARTFLNRLGLEVEVAANGRECLAMLERQPFDLILMDCLMPEMDGYEATREIRRLDHRLVNGDPIPVIALTANAGQEDRDLCRAAGMDEVINKPVEMTKLNQVLGKWLPRPDQQGKDRDLPDSPPRGLKASLNQHRIIDLRTMVGDEFPQPIDSFHQSAARLIEELRGFGAEAPFEERIRVFHSLKSLANNMGATDLAAYAVKLEAASMAGQELNLMQIAGRLEEAFEGAMFEFESV